MTAIDASDMLSPVLVKELRQGLKSRMFNFTFMLMQGAMAISMLIEIMMVRDQSMGTRDREIASAFFWVLAGAPLLLLLPFRSIGAIYNEHRQNTFSLILLTNLTPWRIVTGKWVSLMAQATLIATAILPYAVVRYYLGGVDIVIDLLVLAIIIGTCAFLCAGGLLISTVKHPWRAVGIGAALLIVFSPITFVILVPVGLLIYGMSARPGLIPVQLFLGAGALLHFASCRYANWRFNQKTDGRVGAFISLALLIACIQGAAKFAPVYIALPILLPPAAAFFHRGLALAFPDAKPSRIFYIAMPVFYLLVLGMMMISPVPGPTPLHFFATLATACLLPWLCLYRLWDSPGVFYFVQFIIMLVCAAVLLGVSADLARVPPLMQMLPVISFIVCGAGKADPAFLTVNLGIAALTLFTFARVALASARRQPETPAHAAVA